MNAFHVVTRLRRQDAGADNVAYYEVDPERDKRDVPKPFPAPNADVLHESFVGVAWGLPVSLRGFLENLHVQSLLSHQLLQPSVFFLQWPSTLSPSLVAMPPYF